MNKASVIRWVWIAAIYAILGGIIFAVMGLWFEAIYITPPGYSTDAWQTNLNITFMNTLLCSLGLLLLWNILYSMPLLGGRYKGASVYVLLILWLLLHIVASLGMLLLTVLPILVANRAPFWLFFRLLKEWAIAYGGDFLFLHLLPSLLIIPYFLSLTLFSPEIIAPKFAMFNKLRQHIGLKYSKN
ncbi:MAG: hypothetical protein E7323_01035 [Clostridiales bacterium]|nr:hypothetical protein [Clostridiales bacterium]